MRDQFIEKTQGVRTDLLTKFKHEKLQVLVATDLLSRGSDIGFLPYVTEVTHATEIFLLSPALPARRSPLEGGGSDCAAMTE